MIGKEPTRIVIALNGYQFKTAHSAANATVRPYPGNSDLAELILESPENKSVP